MVADDGVQSCVSMGTTKDSLHELLLLPLVFLECHKENDVFLEDARIHILVRRQMGSKTRLYDEHEYDGVYE